MEDDNLVLVAGLGRGQAERLAAGGIGTLAELGAIAPGADPAACLKAGTDLPRAETFERLRHQAELQLHFRATGERRVDDLPLEEERGYQRLPAPDFGDVWLDLEGHPFYEPARGLEYLFGWCYRDDDGTVQYRAAWARDRDSERAIFEEFVDWVVERRRLHPGLHVYHYASYERTALRRLMGEHGTREHEIDTFLREEVLVDLYRVVREAIRASVDSYSIKVVEQLYGFVRTADVAGGDESTVLFEKWLESGDDTILTEVEAYNEEDCRSTVALHEWLLGRRPPELAWLPPPDQRAAQRGGRGARRRTRPPCATRCSRARRRATPAGSSRSSSTTTSVRPSRSGGSGSSTSSSPTTSSSRTATRSAGSSSSASPSPTGSRSSTRSPSRRRSTRSTTDAVDPRTAEDASRCRSTTRPASSGCGAGRTAPTSRCPPR